MTLIFEMNSGEKNSFIICERWHMKLEKI